MWHTYWGKVCHFMARVEHWGFVAVAAIDTFELHHLLWTVSVVLLVSGFIAAMFNDPA